MANEPMTNEPDYGEPWDDENHYGHITTRDADIVIYGNRVEGLAKQRIISCVNACRGIPDPEKVVPLLADIERMLLSSPSQSITIDCDDGDFCAEVSVGGVHMDFRDKTLHGAVAKAFAALQPKREGERNE